MENVFLDSLAGKKRLLIDLSEGSAGMQRYRFDLTGYAQARAEFEDLCQALYLGSG